MEESCKIYEVCVGRTGEERKQTFGGGFTDEG